MYFSMNERINMFKDFYKNRNYTPLLGFFVGSEYPLKRYDSVKNLPQNVPLKPIDFDTKSFAKDCRELFKLNESFGGEFIWSASAFWGIPWIEALIGMDIFADHNTGSLYAQLPPGETNLSIPEFRDSNPWAVLCKDFLFEIAEESNGDFPLATTRTRGVADILSALFPGEKLIYKMMDAPEEIHELCDKAADLIIDFLNFQLKYIPDFHGGIGSFYYNMWAPKNTVWHQEDAAALLSPELYDEFIAGQDMKISKSFDNCIMHQHPVGYMAYEKFLNMNFTALELHRDEGGPSAKELGDVYNKILLKNRLLIWGNLSDEDLDYIFKELECKGLAVCCVVNTREQADRIWAKYNEAQMGPTQPL